MKYKLLTILVSIIVISVPAARGMANIEIKEIRWGFNNKVIQKTFVPLSVLIENPTEEPFERPLLLQRYFGGSAVGARYYEQVYVGPYSEKWVQFYPYIRNSQDNWQLRWGLPPSERFDIDPGPAFGLPARVLLVERGGLRTTSVLGTFPAELFPGTATATDMLDVVFLDHDPAWQQVQRRAFMDWLYAGGTVHIFHGTDSGFPKFSSDLAELNSPLERLPIGSGLVVRHDFPRAKITREMANRWTKTVANANANRNRPNQPYDAYNVLDRDTEIFGQLRRMR